MLIFLRGILARADYLEKIKLAIVHDYLTQKGGAERTVVAMCEAFPDAPVFTSIYSPRKTLKDFKGRKINVTYLQNLYKVLQNHRILLPLYAKAFESIDLSGFDVILSSSSAFANGVKKPEGAVHISFCYNPARFIWMKDAYLAEENFAFFKAIYLRSALTRLKQWDLNAVRNIDYFIAISSTVKDRIKEFYGRDSSVIYPPVDCSSFGISDKTEDYYLIVSRLIGHKRVDIAIRAFNALGLKLKIVGTGPQYPVLKRMASKNIDFIGGVGEKELGQLYSRCTALIFPQEEDFGIVPLEANASGRPVIAFAKGGALETMKPCVSTGDGGTAVFFHSQTPEDLMAAVKRSADLRFDPGRLRENALSFDKSVFISSIKNKVQELYSKGTK